MRKMVIIVTFLTAKKQQSERHPCCRDEKVCPLKQAVVVISTFFIFSVRDLSLSKFILDFIDWLYFVKIGFFLINHQLGR